VEGRGGVRPRPPAEAGAPCRRAGRSYRAARTVRGVAAFGRSEEEKESGRAEDIFGGCTVGFGGVKLHR
jgi:hypothetical protein